MYELGLHRCSCWKLTPTGGGHMNDVTGTEGAEKEGTLERQG